LYPSGLSGAAIKNIHRLREMDELVVTDTIPLSAEAQIVDAFVNCHAPLLAETVRRINNEESISAMFELF
jgi:ribose-phosphate pyrophosphokinase